MENQSGQFNTVIQPMHSTTTQVSSIGGMNCLSENLFFYREDNRCFSKAPNFWQPILTDVATHWKINKEINIAHFIAMYRATLKGCTSVQVHQPSTSVKIWRNTGMSRRLSVFLAVSVGLKKAIASLFTSDLTSCIMHMQNQNPLWKSSSSLPVTATGMTGMLVTLLVSICVFTIIYLLSLNSLLKTCFVKTLLLEKQEWSVCLVHFSNAYISLYQYSLSKWFIKKSLSLKILHFL